jgi:hypothetical protein
MKFSDPNNPGEKKKLIAAIALGLIAVIVLGYVLFGGSSKPAPPNNSTARPATPTPVRAIRPQSPEQPGPDESSIFQPIKWPPNVPAVGEADRNIFAYYVAPPTPLPTPKVIPTATPTPVPPLTASSLAPSNVYAGSPADFSLQVVGDKFTPAVHLVVDGRDLPTRFINTQQLFTTVPASLIAAPGPRTVIARNNDGALYSNSLTLTVQQPPLPNYTFVGIIGKPRGNDTAVLLDKANKDLSNVQRGDPVGGRFRVMSISDKEVILIDSTLKIKHHLPFTVEPGTNQPYRPPARVVDEEP